VWVMFPRSNLFKNYIISCPSLGFDKMKMYDVDNEYATANDDLKLTVCFGLADLNKCSKQDSPGNHGSVDSPYGHTISVAGPMTVLRMRSSDRCQRRRH